MIYFKYLLLSMGDLSPNDGIIYSELVFNSLTSNSVYMTGELLYIEAAKEETARQESNGGIGKILFYPLGVRELMQRTDMTFPTVKKSLAYLERSGYIMDDYLRCPFDLLNGGYIKLPERTGLKGRQLVFYSYLLSKAKKYGGIIDTWAYRLGEVCGISKDNVYFVIKELKRKDLVARLSDGRLKIIGLSDKKRGAFQASPHDKNS